MLLPNVVEELWSKKTLSGMALEIGKPIGAQRLGKPNDRTSTMLKVLADQAFTLPEVISVDLIGYHGEV